MPTLTTFGFEFEVATEGAALTRHLYEQGHTGQVGMCPWHCSCNYCAFGTGNFLFRAQTDSSVPRGGEIITNILHHDPNHARHAEDVFGILQRAAVEVDAEPGLDAGLHVHVGIQHLNADELNRAFWAYLRYENVLNSIAAGRWVANRGANNNVMSTVNYLLTDYAGGDDRGLDAIATIEDNGLENRTMRTIRDEAYGGDRHTNLNMRTNHGTWEYRLWNSTRAAWRMEMYTRLSVALVDPEVNAAMLAAPLTRRVTRRAIDRFASLLMDCGHDTAADLVDRQATYSTDRAETAPSTLTQL